MVEVERFGPELDRLWDRLKGVHTFGLWRDSSYWSWRYLDCPSVIDRLLSLLGLDGELRGAAVVRGRWLDKDVLALVDGLVLCDDSGAAQTLLDAEEAASSLLSLQTRFHPEQPETERFRGQGFESRETFFNLCIRLDDPDLTQSRIKPVRCPEW